MNKCKYFSSLKYAIRKVMGWEKEGPEKLKKCIHSGKTGIQAGSCHPLAKVFSTNTLRVWKNNS